MNQQLPYVGQLHTLLLHCVSHIESKDFFKSFFTLSCSSRKISAYSELLQKSILKFPIVLFIKVLCFIILSPRAVEAYVGKNKKSLLRFVSFVN